MGIGLRSVGGLWLVQIFSNYIFLWNKAKLCIWTDQICWIFFKSSFRNHIPKPKHFSLGYNVGLKAGLNLWVENLIFLWKPLCGVQIKHTVFDWTVIIIIAKQIKQKIPQNERTNRNVTAHVLHLKIAIIICLLCFTDRAYYSTAKQRDVSLMHSTGTAVLCILI